MNQSIAPSTGVEDNDSYGEDILGDPDPESKKSTIPQNQRKPRKS